MIYIGEIMKQKQGKDFLIRNMPIEVYTLLEKAAQEHHRSKTQEAIVVLSNALSPHKQLLAKPKPLKWKTKISDEFIEDAIREGRE